jgi:ABC transporter substrate binding protein
MTACIGRRDFITLLGGAAGWPLAARAQQGAKLPTIGILGTTTASAWEPWTAAFVQRLRELGWIEGHNLAIEYRWAEGRSERFAEIAAEFVRLKVGVIVTGGNAAAAAKQATSVVPIVFVLAVDPVGWHGPDRKSGATGGQRHRLVEPADRYGRQAVCHVKELTWTTQRQISLTSTFQNAMTTLTLGFPPSSVSSCTVTRTMTLGFFARAFAHSRSIISAFSTSVSRRCMNILHDKRPLGRRATEQRDELASLQLCGHSITSSARASTVGGSSRPSALAVLRLMTSSYFVGACTGKSAGFSPLRMRST